jgi:hypothetical protein
LPKRPAVIAKRKKSLEIKKRITEKFGAFIKDEMGKCVEREGGEGFGKNRGD